MYGYHSKGKNVFYCGSKLQFPECKEHYKNTQDGTKLVSQLFADSLDKFIDRKITLPKKKGKDAADFDFVRLQCYTQPHLTGIGKKKPEVFELAIGGNKEQQLADRLNNELAHDD